MKKKYCIFVLLIIISTILSCDRDAEIVFYKSMIAFVDATPIIECTSDTIEVDITVSDSLTLKGYSYIVAQISNSFDIKYATKSVIDETEWGVEVVPPTFDSDGVVDLSVRSYVRITPSKFAIENSDNVLLNVTIVTNDGSSYSISKIITIPIESISLKKVVPHIYINTENGADIVSKEEYINATIEIDGMEMYDDFKGTTRIKGRGNSTWNYAKKPYKIKLDEKASLLGLEEEKDWVLLANYLDPTLIFNPVAMYIGSYLDVPYVNHMIGVDVTINSEYQGFYCFTEQIEVKPARVNLSDAGYLLELDQYYDAEWQYKSPIFDLPVMLKDGNVETQADFDNIISEFNELEYLIASADFPNNNYEEYIDIESVANFIIVYQLLKNREMSWPKSVYMFKDVDTKFTLGPIWDFDWCCGYDGTDFFTSLSYTGNIFVESTTSLQMVGSDFFTRFFSDPQFVEIYKERWNYFRWNYSEDVFEYIDLFSGIIKPSAETNFILWSNGKVFDDEITKFKAWLTLRINYLDTQINSL